MNRKNNYKFKLLTIQATIDTIFVNEKIIIIYSSCLFSPWNTRQMHFKRSIVSKQSLPHDPLKSQTGGWWNEGYQDSWISYEITLYE